MWINTALGLTDDVARQGLGWHNRDKVATTLDLVNRYMGLTRTPPVESIYTNEFVGSVKLTADEWQRARERAKAYLTR
jgi:hypothetical protein